MSADMRILVRATNKGCKKTEEKYIYGAIHKALEKVNKITKEFESEKRFNTRMIHRNLPPYLFQVFS